MLALWLSLHVLGAVIAFGPVFAFPFLGVAADKHPAAAPVIHKLIHQISTRLVMPVALTMAVTGALLIHSTKLDVSKNPWLGAGIILYVLVLAAAFGVQVPTERKVIALIDNAAGAPAPGVEPLMMRIRLVGMAMGLAVLVIIVLMVWKPGFTG